MSDCPHGYWNGLYCDDCRDREAMQKALDADAREIQDAHEELARLRAEKAELVRDCEILLANLDWLTECFGEGPEDEDAALVRQIRAKLARAQSEPHDSEGERT